jgi:hypothetical protein
LEKIQPPFNAPDDLNSCAAVGQHVMLKDPGSRRRSDACNVGASSDLATETSVKIDLKWFTTCATSLAKLALNDQRLHWGCIKDGGKLTTQALKLHMSIA